MACGAVLQIKGADFPALPTAPRDADVGAAAGAVSDATGEEPLVLALGPMVVQQRVVLPPGGAPRATFQPSARGSNRWMRLVLGGCVALATAGAAFLLVLDGPGTDARSPAPPPDPAASMRPSSGGPTPSQEAALAASPTTPADRGGPAGGGVEAPALERVGGVRPPTAPAAPAAGPGATRVPSPQKTAPRGPPAAASPSKRVAGLPARSVASASGPVSDSAEAAAHSRPPPDRMVAEALAARRPAFEACLRDWLQDNPGGPSGRRVSMTLVVNPNGTVSVSSLDDPTIEATALGACLRGVVSRPFQAFEGEPLHVIVPLRLGQ